MKYNKLFRITVFFVVLLLGCYLLNTNIFIEVWEPKYILAIVNMAAYLLNFVGMTVQTDGSYIFTNEFSLNIGPACIASYEIFVFSAAIISYPLHIKDKIIGIIAGVIAIWSFNLLRVVAVFTIGLFFPNKFKLFHDHVFQAIFILFMVILWCFWISKSQRTVIAQ